MNPHDMIYYRCPSCGTDFSSKQLTYEKKLNKICDDGKLSEDAKNDKKMALLDEFFPKQFYCCRARILGYY